MWSEWADSLRGQGLEASAFISMVHHDWFILKQKYTSTHKIAVSGTIILYIVWTEWIYKAANLRTFSSFPGCRDLQQHIHAHEKAKEFCKIRKRVCETQAAHVHNSLWVYYSILIPLWYEVSAEMLKQQYLPLHSFICASFSSFGLAGGSTFTAKVAAQKHLEGSKILRK